jgi:hypothetical protein
MLPRRRNGLCGDSHFNELDGEIGGRGALPRRGLYQQGE